MKNPEDREQAALFEWAGYHEVKHPELRALYAIPNGGKRSKAEAAILKATGVKRGVVDVCLPVQRGGYGSLWIEMKRPGNIKGTTPEQRDWIALMLELGNLALVCDSWSMASDAILHYLNLERPKP